MIDRSELCDAARKAFPSNRLTPPREASFAQIVEMGWPLVALPEEQGGLGLGREAATVLQFEMGRMLSAAPLTPTLVALDALSAAEHITLDRQSWVDRLSAGELVSLSFAGTRLADATTFTGTIMAVPDADLAGHLLVFAPGLATLVPLSPTMLTERQLWDESRRFFDVTICGHQPDSSLVVASGSAADDLADRVDGANALGLAADSLGGAAALLDMTLEYLKMRRQFDRPLAMFQALKHRCADLRVEIAAAEALMWERSRTAHGNAIDLGALKALATEAYVRVAEEAIQLHGGIGLTTEHPCHLFMKRAMLNRALGRSNDTCLEAAGQQALARFRA